MKIKILLIFILLFATPGITIAQVMGKYEAILPLYDQNRYLGEVRAVLEGEKLLSIDKASLIDTLSKNLGQDTLRQFENLGATIDPLVLPLPVRFNPQEFRLEMTFGVELRSKEEIDLGKDFHKRYGKESIQPALIGGAINSRLEQNWTAHPGETNFSSGQFDSFININSIVLENQSFYQSNIDKKFFRGDTRLVKDFEKQQVRFQAGDVTPQVQGFMASRPIGGINISRNFNLNPYRLPYPSGTQDFILQTRSWVKYFVNGTLIKSEYLPPGNYTATEMPLNNGLNTIVIEATDDLGQKKVFVYKSASSINLLHKGDSRFDLSYGTPVIDLNFDREYRHEDGNLLSSYYQYGLTHSFTTSLYGQNQKEFNLLGGEVITSTMAGNFGVGFGHSHFEATSGDAQAVSYQLVGTHTLALRYEHRSENFKSSITDNRSIFHNLYSASLSFPVANHFTAMAGTHYENVRDNNLSDRYGYDTTFNIRLYERHNLSLYMGRTRDQHKIWNDIAYAFITIAFPDSNDFASVFHNIQDNSSKLTYNRDNQNRLYSPRLAAQVRNDSIGQAGEVDVLVPTPIAEIGGRVNADHHIEDDRYYNRTSLRVNSGLLFAYDDGEWGTGISRPVTSSFAIFKTEERLNGQKIALKSTSPYTEAETGIFGELAFANLLPYQYREIQLDPTFLDEGRALKKERFVLYPTYKSANLVKLYDKGSVMLKGFLQRKDGSPWALQVGQVGTITFFTNRDGEFFIEGIEAGAYKLKLNGVDAETDLFISDQDRGIKNAGTLILEEE